MFFSVPQLQIMLKILQFADLYVQLSQKMYSNIASFAYDPTQRKKTYEITEVAQFANKTTGAK